MPPTRTHEEELRIQAERKVKFKGTACIRLEWLHFQGKKPRELKRKNVERLKSNFRKKCDRLPIKNHIPALIEQQHLDVALQASGILPATLLSNPDVGYPDLVIPAGYQLECLHGRHRIQAAKEVLPLRDKWWTVDLYLADANRELRSCLIEDYANEEKPTDGEIYCKIRQYHFQHNLSFEQQWWTWLTPQKSKNLKQLLRHDDYRATFDAFLQIPSLLEGGLILGIWHKVAAVRCDEQYLRYLHHTLEFWSMLLQRDLGAMEKVDQDTVKALELTAPWASTLDAKALRSQVLGGAIFSNFTRDEREGIWRRLSGFKGLVPSIRSFFRNYSYVEACMNCIKRLTSLRPGETVSTALERAFSSTSLGLDHTVIQVTESTFRSRSASFGDRVELGCRQLYAYAMRHFLDMPREPQARDRRATSIAKADPAVLRGFADLASRLGFDSPEIMALKQYPHSTANIVSSDGSRPLLVTAGPGESIDRRWGCPGVGDYEADKEFLFIDHFHDTKEEQGEGITSFFIRKFVYLNFFGRPSPATIVSPTPDHSTTEVRVASSLSTHPDPQAHLQLVVYEDHLGSDDMAVDTGTLQDESQQLDNIDVVQQEQERLAEEQAEQERLARQEQERLARIEQEKQELERLARAQLEKQEQERLTRIEQERQEQERQAQERQEQERQEQERQEQERLAQLELERIAQEQRERENQAKMEQKRQEQERLARIEQERQEERLEQERREQERARLEREKLEQERHKEEQEQNEREREERQRAEQEDLLDEDLIDQVERAQKEESVQAPAGEVSTSRAPKRGTQIDIEKAINDSKNLDDLHSTTDQRQETPQGQTQETAEHTTSAPIPTPGQDPRETLIDSAASAARLARLDTTKIRIKFKFLEEGIWKDITFRDVDPFDPSEIERMAKEHMRQGMRPFDTELRLLAPCDCFPAVVADGTNTILLVPESKISITEELRSSASDVRIDALSHQERILKRVTNEDISQLHHLRKKQNARTLR